MEEKSDIKIDSKTETTAKAKVSKPGKRKGKGATQRSTDAMRERKGRPILDAYRAELRRKLLGDETGELEIALTNMSLTVQPRATPSRDLLKGAGLTSDDHPTEDRPVMSETPSRQQVLAQRLAARTPSRDLPKGACLTSDDQPTEDRPVMSETPSRQQVLAQRLAARTHSRDLPKGAGLTSDDHPTEDRPVMSETPSRQQVLAQRLAARTHSRDLGASTKL
ncbi:unnamed protein product [Brassicogethes aeneus]|uniref:Uncharacterized protein n=1 Tax=Brassicogethes aeneus TaxID=1431903 RepID=A0A9P0BIL2_BRAAE|nr:unnamed protein product [Brassicogethes aeneus]